MTSTGLDNDALVVLSLLQEIEVETGKSLEFHPNYSIGKQTPEDLSNEYLLRRKGDLNDPGKSIRISIHDFQDLRTLRDSALTEKKALLKKAILARFQSEASN